MSRIIGVVLLDTIDNDFLGIAMGRDEVGQFRAFDMSVSFVTAEDAEGWLHRTMRWHVRIPVKMNTDSGGT